MKKEFIAKENAKLSKLILNEFPKLNFNQIKTALRKKDIKINGERIREDKEISTNDKVEIFLPLEKEREIEVVYQDENILIANKPQGIEVKKEDKAYNETKSIEEYFSAFACHRIDKNTEGLVILAKSKQTLKEFEIAFKNNYIKKYYLAVVGGKPKDSAHLFAYLKKDSEKSLVKIYKDKVENSVEIETSYKLLKTSDDLSLLEVELHTGKTHQIRAHLAFVNLPILGDEKYGNKALNKKYHIKKQQLCAYNLKFNFDKNSKLYYLNNKEFKIEPNFKVKI